MSEAINQTPQDRVQEFPNAEEGRGSTVDPSTAPSPEPQTELAFGERAFTLRELGEANLRQPKELIEGMLFEGETVPLLARPKTGKTRLAQQLAVAVAEGPDGDFLGQEVGFHAPVLYVDLESRPVDARNRFVKIAGEQWDSVQDKIHIYCVETLADSQVGLIGEGQEKLNEMLQETNAGLMIIDTWRLVFSGKENDADTMVKNLRWLDGLRAVNPELSILLLHHLRKHYGGNSPRLSLREDPQLWLENASGSHAFIAHTDGAIGMEQEGKGQTSLFVLNGARRNGPTPLLVLKSNEDTLRFERVGESEKDRLLVFTRAQVNLWSKLPEAFSWGEAEKIAGGSAKKSLLSETLKRAKNCGLLSQISWGGYVKTQISLND